MRALFSSILVVSLAALPAAFVACGGSDGDAAPTPGEDGGPGTGPGGRDGQAVLPDGGPAGEEPAVTGPCLTRFTYRAQGAEPRSVEVSGEWSQFARPGAAMVRGADGQWSVDAELPKGLHGYKLVVDGQWQLDPGTGLRKYVGGVENSAVRVAGCDAPTTRLGSQELTRAQPGAGRYAATVQVRRGHDRPPIDQASLHVRLRSDTGTKDLEAVRYEPTTGTLSLDVPNLADGKYTVLVDLADQGGAKAKTLRLTFWVEAERFEWQDALIYMAMVDRFQNGTRANDQPMTPGQDPRIAFQGGDLEGLRQRVADGTFDQLGVRALWLSPFHVNPDGAYPADNGVAQPTGYHGYWPIKARGVERRIGGEAELHALVAEAHKHGIRILQDFVVNHVHEGHEYVAQHKDWFRTGCVCGSDGCDWTGRRLDCLFASYLPDVNWSVTEASEQFIDDAAHWVEDYDLDGLRVDAVKHVEDAAAFNLTARIREDFEAAGTRVFLTGETAMGWNDCGLACNASEYGTISRYMGPYGLDGQFDFVLHHAVPYRVFAYDQKGMAHADYWTQASVSQYPKGGVMTPYIGSHDTPRFVTLATYRGQAGYPMDVPSRKWADWAGPPPNAEPYERHRLAMAWLYTIPGAPLLYYGDEYGEWGGSDPNNRTMWRGAGQLSSEEQKTLAFTRKLGQARKELEALRRGEYRSLLATEDDLLFARQTQAGAYALVALTRNPAGASVSVQLPVTFPAKAGDVLRDRLGGSSVTVSADRRVTATLGPRGAAILAP